VRVLRCLTCVAVAFPVLASGVQAAGPRNGTYYGYDADGGAVVAATVKNGRIPVLQAMPPVDTGPGVSFYYGPIGQGSDRIGRSGKWTTGVTPGGPLGPDYLTVCGNTLGSDALGVSFNCNSGSGNDDISGRPQFRARPSRKSPPANGTYSGSVSQTTSSTGSSGTDGTLTLTVSRGTVTGSATLAPVDATTGVATGPPSVDVSYGPVASGTNDASAKGNSYLAEDCASPPYLTRLGMFCLPSTPPGYTLIGGFVPVGVKGLPRRGLVSGTVYTAPTQSGPDGSQTFGPALPGAFAITASR
jgi:hypothetical protein